MMARLTEHFAAFRNPPAGELPELAEFLSSDVVFWERSSRAPSVQDSDAPRAVSQPRAGSSQPPFVAQPCWIPDRIPNGMGAGARSCSTEIPLGYTSSPPMTHTRSRDKWVPDQRRDRAGGEKTGKAREGQRTPAKGAYHSNSASSGE
jgi:hypothetical protein